MLSSSLFAMIKMSKTSSPQKLFDYDCVTLYVSIDVSVVDIEKVNIDGSCGSIYQNHMQ